MSPHPRTRRAALAAVPLALALLALPGCLGGDGGGGGTPPPPVTCDANVCQQVVDEINEERAANGLPALVVDVRLAAAAQVHSEDMADVNTLSHTGSTGSDPADRAAAAGYPIVALGENVAAGQTTAVDVVGDWMSSPGHRANILGASFTHVGVGWAWTSASPYHTYWTADFGASSDAGSPPPDGCHPAP